MCSWRFFRSVALCRKQVNRFTELFTWLKPAVLTAIALALSSSAAKAEDNVDHLAAAKAAEHSLHAACDTWVEAAPHSKERALAANRIVAAFEDFYRYCRVLNSDPKSTFKIIFIATGAQPRNKIVAAGRWTDEKGAVWSYVVWWDEGALLMTGWKREEWYKEVKQKTTTYYVAMGGCCGSLKIAPQEVAKRIRFGQAIDCDLTRRPVLRIPYTLDGRSGVVLVRLQGYRFHMEPDRGAVNEPDRGLVGATSVWYPEP